MTIMVDFRHSGGFERLEEMLRKTLGKNWQGILDKYGQRGVEALRDMTPIDTGMTANSWHYEIIQNGSGVSVVWNNSNVNDGVNIALILQTGHGTRNGGYVVGVDYINPALQPIFDELAQAAWKEVTE